jgi:hypothetical protein
MRPVRLSLLCLAMFLPGFATSIGAQCPDQTFDAFEAQGYKVRSVRVRGPLVDGNSLRDQVVAPMVTSGAPVRATAIESGKQALRAALLKRPSLFESRVAATIVVADVDACDQTAKQLDVVYRIFTTKVALGLSRTFESHPREVEDPAARLAIGETPARYRIAPLVRYDALEGLVGGARVSLALGRAFDRLEMNVEASNSVANLDLDLSGSLDTDAGFIRTFEWRVGYHNHDRPTDEHELKEQGLAGQMTVATRPLGSIGGVVRFASALEAGDQDTNIAAGDLPPAYLRNAGYGRWKNAVGVTFRSRRHAFSGSYGLQLGHTRGRPFLDYTKSIGELGYDGHFAPTTGWLRHRPLGVTSRSAIGRLNGDDNVPAAERFFGGNMAVPFLTGEGWDFRGNPVLRSFPASSFSRLANGAAAGGDNFFSFNLTASIPAWFRPLVPPDVAADAFVRQAINGQLQSAETTLETSHKIQDPAHRRAVEAGQALKSILAAVRSRVAEILPTIQEPLKATAESCDEQADMLLAVVESITPKTYVGSLLAEPVDEDDATLSSVLRVCIDNLNARLADTALSAIGEQLAAARGALAEQIAHIDSANARRLAARDMTFARGAVDTIFDELNAVSVGPVLVFDVARLGQHAPPSRALTRYGVGAGVRLSIASAFHVSAGYVWNLDRSAPERHGAAFAAVELSTLFGR